MHTRRAIRTLLFAAATLTVGFAGLSGAAAQEDDSTTSTTQLDLGGEQDASTTSTPESTTTTQLEVGGEHPTRVDAGAGGTAPGSTIPLSGIALAGGLVIVTGAAALKMRREFRA